MPFLHNLRTGEEYFEKTGDGWNAAQHEAHQAHALLGMFSNEVATCEAMREHQGSLVPKLLATVDLELETQGSTAETPDCGDFEPFRLKGVLLDYIEGCDLNEVVQHFPRSSWKYIVDEAVKIIYAMDKLNILNRDVHERNFVISGASDSVVSVNQGEPAQPRVYMIDLAMCRVRRPDESDGEWGRAKHKEGEALFGVSLKEKWKKRHNFELDYEYKMPYRKYADRWCDLCGLDFVHWDLVYSSE